MLLGIDVGGTFTDAVLIGRGTIIAQAKRRTTHEAVLQGILEALDEVLQEQEVYNIERVVISSTIVTNALTEGRTDPVFLAVMTGPGMNVSKSFPVEPYYVSGYVDHRGKITARIDWQKHQGLLSKAKNKMAAVSGKFSVRNPENEYALAGELKDCGYEKIFLGSELSGELNFVRRTNSAYFAAAVRALHSGGHAAFGAGRHRCRAGAAGPLLCRGCCFGVGRIAGLPLWRPTAFVLGGWYSAGSRHRPVHLPV